jgi:hydroxymethylbilane synthase
VSVVEKIIIGTRGSRLATIQTQTVAEALRQRAPHLKVDVCTVKTGGDRDKTTPFASFGEKGIFVKELEDELLTGGIDAAVHSLKDLPTELPGKLLLAAVLPRESPLDCLVSQGNKRLSELAAGAVVGTGSLRRGAFVLRQRPDLQIREIRGNLDTRLRKVHAGDYGAIVTSQAAMSRIGKTDMIAEVFPAIDCLPAPGQGAIAVEVHSDAEALRELISVLDDYPTHMAVAAERSFLEALGGGCRVPVGSLAVQKEGTMELRGSISAPDGTTYVEGEKTGKTESIGDAEKLGATLGQELMARGGKELLSW